MQTNCCRKERSAVLLLHTHWVQQPVTDAVTPQCSYSILHEVGHVLPRDDFPVIHQLRGRPRTRLASRTSLASLFLFLSLFLLWCCCPSRLLHKERQLPSQNHRKSSRAYPSKDLSFFGQRSPLCSFFQKCISVISPVCVCNTTVFTHFFNDAGYTGVLACHGTLIFTNDSCHLFLPSAVHLVSTTDRQSVIVRQSLSFSSDK